MQVSLQYATQHLEELASAVDNGEEIEIARPEKSAIKLIVSANTAQPEFTEPRVLGALRGRMVVPSEEEWRKMDQELAGIMTNGPVFPPE